MDSRRGQDCHLRPRDQLRPRGHGRQRERPPPTLDRYLAELSSVIAQARGDRPFILAGHSLGGLTVRIYAQQDPADVAGLVLVDATPEAVAGDPAVKAGFLASAAMTSVFRVLAPFRFCPVSLAIGKMPLYPEQDVFRSAVSAEDYRR
jgi:pimeloyl-ACP methyl ester carboxylesterase